MSDIDEMRRRRTFAIISHPDAGKTTVTEKLLLYGKALSVGRVSAHSLLHSTSAVGKLIKEIHQLPESDIPVKVTYHPAYLLRNPSAKSIAWQDMKTLHQILKPESNE